MDTIEEFRKWCISERQSIEKSREFWYYDYNADMVHYENARLDELKRVLEKIEE